MSDELTQVQNEAVQLEMNARKLYVLFARQFPEDAAFWQQLAIEENNHAELIRSGVDLFKEAGVPPTDVLAAPMNSLRAANNKLTELIEKYEENAPTRANAFYTALATEQSAGEIHFQHLMTRQADSRIVELFQQLNQDDKQHTARILTYMQDHGIDETRGSKKSGR